ncbi:MAG: hypothetical protein WCR49_03515 [Opitutae bacterium]
MRFIFQGARLVGGFALILALGERATLAGAKPVTPPPDAFSPMIELAPFVAKGKQLSVSIHARSASDRRYAEAFSEEVMKVVYEGVTESPGKGLVIIGRKGEPHPSLVFRKFLALAEAGKIDPAIAARGPELFSMLNHWQHTVNAGKAEDVATEGNVDLEFEKIIAALPLPLEGLGAKLYQLAWFEKFDDAKVEAKLCALHPADLERNLFAHFDWVFYLPPKGAFDQVLDQLIADALKEDGAGFFARTAVKGVMLVVKPKIRQAIEGVRKGVMFQTVVQARTTLSEGEVLALTGAYIETMMPGEDRTKGGTAHERAVIALHDQLRKNAEPAREPATEPAAAEATLPASNP